MSATTQPTPPERLTSIDAFRGFVILAMVFVNYIPGMKNIPWWMKHLPNEVYGMTFVDVVFPAFMFIVGMVIPIALEGRLRRTGSVAKTFGHVLSRFLGLIIIGVLMVNISGLSPEQAGISKYLWGALMFVFVMVTWLASPREWPLRHVVRGLGIVGLVLLVATYRRADGSWMRTEWWGILGLIGWAYLTGCVCFIVARRNVPALFGCMAGLIALYELREYGWLSPVLDPVLQWVNLGSQIGSHGSIVVAGIIAGVWVTSDLPQMKKLRRLLIFAAGLIAAGFAFTTLHGFHKNYATESWALASAGWTLLVYSAFYYVMDMLRKRAWAAPLEPAGRNPLLAYILPSFLIYTLLVVANFSPGAYFNVGFIGVLHGLVFTAFILALTAGANRVGLLLKF